MHPRTSAERATLYESMDTLQQKVTNHSQARQYLVVTLGDAKEATPVVSKTLNPEWNQIFDLPVTGIESLLLEAHCWDKDRFGKDYMGEFDVALEEIFKNGQTTQEVGKRGHAHQNVADCQLAQVVQTSVEKIWEEEQCHFWRGTASILHCRS